jgi:hypothetical protein
MSEVKLSRLQRWILATAYQEIMKAGTDQPTKEKDRPVDIVPVLKCSPPAG